MNFIPLCKDRPEALDLFKWALANAGQLLSLMSYEELIEANQINVKLLQSVSEACACALQDKSIHSNASASTGFKRSTNSTSLLVGWQLALSGNVTPPMPPFEWNPLKEESATDEIHLPSDIQPPSDWLHFDNLFVSQSLAPRICEAVESNNFSQESTDSSSSNSSNSEEPFNDECKAFNKSCSLQKDDCFNFEVNYQSKSSSSGSKSDDLSLEKSVSFDACHELTNGNSKFAQQNSSHAAVVAVDVRDENCGVLLPSQSRVSVIQSKCDPVSDDVSCTKTDVCHINCNEIISNNGKLLPSQENFLLTDSDNSDVLRSKRRVSFIESRCDPVSEDFNSEKAFLQHANSLGADNPANALSSQGQPSVLDATCDSISNNNDSGCVKPNISDACRATKSTLRMSIMRSLLSQPKSDDAAMAKSTAKSSAKSTSTPQTIIPNDRTVLVMPDAANIPQCDVEDMSILMRNLSKAFNRQQREANPDSSNTDVLVVRTKGNNGRSVCAGRRPMPRIKAKGIVQSLELALKNPSSLENGVPAVGAPQPKLSRRQMRIQGINKAKKAEKRNAPRINTMMTLHLPPNAVTLLKSNGIDVCDEKTAEVLASYVREESMKRQKGETLTREQLSSLEPEDVMMSKTIDHNLNNQYLILFDDTSYNMHLNEVGACAIVKLYVAGTYVGLEDGYFELYETGIGIDFILSEGDQSGRNFVIRIPFHYMMGLFYHGGASPPSLFVTMGNAEIKSLCETIDVFTHQGGHGQIVVTLNGTLPDNMIETLRRNFNQHNKARFKMTSPSASAAALFPNVSLQKRPQREIECEATSDDVLSTSSLSASANVCDDSRLVEKNDDEIVELQDEAVAFSKKKSHAVAVPEVANRSRFVHKQYNTDEELLVSVCSAHPDTIFSRTNKCSLTIDVDKVMVCTTAMYRLSQAKLSLCLRGLELQFTTGELEKVASPHSQVRRVHLRLQYEHLLSPLYCEHVHDFLSVELDPIEMEQLCTSLDILYETDSPRLVMWLVEPQKSRMFGKLRDLYEAVWGVKRRVMNLNQSAGELLTKKFNALAARREGRAAPIMEEVVCEPSEEELQSFMMFTSTSIARMEAAAAAAAAANTTQ